MRTNGVVSTEDKPLSKAFYALISLPATAMGFALCIQISALSWLLHTQLGLDDKQVGIVWAAGPLAGILGQVIVGFASDKVWFWGGRRRPFILIGGVLAALMVLALPFIREISAALGVSLIGVAIAVALTLDLAINVSFNPTRSIIADVTPEGNARTQGFTWMQTISGSFGVMAYLIGAFFGNFALIYVGAAVVFLFAVFPPFFIKEPRQLVSPPDEGSFESREEKAAPPSQLAELLKIYVAHAFAWLGIQTMFVFIFSFIKGHLAENFHLDDGAIGETIDRAFVVLNTVGFLLPSFVLEPVTKKIGRVRTHALCMGIMALGYLGIATAASSPNLLYALILVVGIGWAATVSLPFAIFSEKVDPTQMGIQMGIFNLSVVLPQLVVSAYFGGVIERAADKSIVFYISAASLAVSAVLWLLVKEQPSSGTAKKQLIGGAH